MLKRWLLALALPVFLGGCYVHGRGSVAYAAYDPPPPRYVYADYRPGYVWVDGYWYWNSDRYLWRDGYYVRERPGYVWVQGTYHGRQFRPGYWNRGGYRRDVVVRPAPQRPVRYVAPSRGPARLHVVPNHRR
jgi:hypothetical protein